MLTTAIEREEDAFECAGVPARGSSKGTLLHHAKNGGKLI